MRIYFTRLLFLGIFITGVCLLYFFNPENTAYPPCLFKKLTSLQCPGCGSARACYHLLKGNFIAAVDYNLLLTGFFPLITLECFSRFFFKGNNGVSKLRVIENHIRPVQVLMLVLVFWIVRNLPVYPFNMLSSDH